MLQKSGFVNGFTANNEMLLYDVIDMKNTEFDINKQQTNP